MSSRCLLIALGLSLLEPAELVVASALRPLTLSLARAHRLHHAQRFPQRQLLASEQPADAEEPAAAADAEEAPAEKSAVQLEREALQAEIAQLESQLFTARGDLVQAQDDLKDAGEAGYMLTAADFERYRLQCRSELESQAGYGRSNGMRPLLGFVQQFEQLQQIEAPAATDEEMPIHTFYGGIYKQLTALLGENAVSRFDVALGDAYDYKIHEDVERVHSESVPNNCVAGVFEGGWMMGNEALQRAKVQISMGPQAAEAPPQEAAEAGEQE